MVVTFLLTLFALVLSFVSVFFLNHWSIDLKLKGDAVQTIEYGEAYAEEGADATFHGSRIFRRGWPVKVKEKGEVDVSQLGEYTLSYHAGVLFWNSETERVVSVVDTTPPDITLVETEGMFLLPGQTYEEEGFTATDLHDGDLTASVLREESEDWVRYTVTDSSGNTATVERALPHKDPLPPTLTLAGEAEITMQAGSIYTEPGWTAVDNVDGDLTAQVNVSGTVNSAKAGTYTLKYSVTDSYGNETTVKRIVTVEPRVQKVTDIPDSKVVYLTFDDGPSKHTRRLLDVLAEYNVKATFFTCKTAYSDLIADEYKEGHTVAIHSATHEYSEIYASKSAYFKDLQKQSDLITKLTGETPRLVRFPGGSSNTVSRRYCSGIMTTLAKELHKQGYEFFDWNVLSGDAGETQSTDEVYKNVINGLKNHDDVAVVLQHDTEGFSVDAVERIIIWGLDNGYTFLPLDIDSFPAHQTIAN